MAQPPHPEPARTGAPPPLDEKPRDSDSLPKMSTTHLTAPSPTSSPENPLRRRRDPPPTIRQMSHETRTQTERSLVRKIDIRLLPMLILMYIMNYLDRNNIAAARLAGLTDPKAKGGLDLTSTQYLTCLSILFVGYLLMQVPSNLFLNKIGRPSLYLPACMVVWGVISAATGEAQGFGGLLAIRFMLGFVEAAYFPGCLFFLSSWYTRGELGFRTAVLYSGSLLSGAFSGLISAGIKNGLDGARGMRAWRWLFIIEGVITVGIAFAAVFILPDFPRTTKWLTEEERELAIWRLEEDIGEDDWVGSKEQTLLHGFNLAIRDFKTWILMVIVFCFVASGTVTNLFPSVVQTLGYGEVQTLLLTVPPYALAVITTFLNSWHADRTGERYFHVTLPLYFSVIAFIIAATTTSVGPRYFAMMLMPAGVYTGYVVSLAWISNTLPRPPAKRAAALALINAVSNSSSIYASYMYPESAGPRFIVAMSVNCVTSFIGIVFATILRFVLMRLNKKLDRGEPVRGAIAEGEAVPGKAAERGFRFVL